jgi:hypothetical protein
MKICALEDESLLRKVYYLNTEYFQTLINHEEIEAESNLLK